MFDLIKLDKIADQLNQHQDNYPDAIKFEKTAISVLLSSRSSIDSPD